MAVLLSVTMARAMGGPVETSLRRMLEDFELAAGGDILNGLAAVAAACEAHGLVCDPPIGAGDLDAPRVLSSVTAGSLASVLAEISGLETAQVEFKSSLQVDRRRMAKDPGRPARDYRSEDVLKSALKTIAAFANGRGGVLYLGVEDNGAICGLMDDFLATGVKGDYDGWDLHLRSLIKSRFSDGPAFNAYVRTKCYEFEDRYFVQARIAPRSRLTFLKTDETWDLFVRTGTQTNAIPYCDIEKHFSLTPLY